jgi:DNA-binding transcriptional ArsR family regulator
VSRVDDAVFAALGDPTRRRIAEWLGGEGPASASALARRLPMSRQAVAKHLAVLRRAGLVVPGRDGREVRYRLRPEPLTDATEWMARLGARWDERLARLRDLLEPPPGAS